MCAFLCLICFLKCSFNPQVFIPWSFAACFRGCDEQWPELCTALCPPLWNTMPHTSITVTSGATGDQLSACVPLLWDSWSHQSATTPTPSPVASVWPGLTTTTTNNNIIGLSHLVCRSFRGHFVWQTKICLWTGRRRHFFTGFWDRLSKSQIVLSYWKTFDAFVISLQTRSSPGEQFYGACDGHKLIRCWSHSTQHVQSQAFLLPQMESIEAHYCVLGGASSTMNSLAHF